MRVRATSSLAVVVGLLPAIIGGPVFAVAMAALGALSAGEFVALARRLPAVGRVPPTALVAVPLFALAALARWPPPAASGLAFAAALVPLVLLFPAAGESGAFAGWALAVAGTAYVGVPIVAAVALREGFGTVEAVWLGDLAGLAALGWPAAPRGLAWVLLVLIVTWIGDTLAYLVGRAVGRRPLAPHLSPKKTVEGSIGGLAGSMLAAVACDAAFGLRLGLPLAVGIGLLFGIVGQVGDLGESLLKRQAGAKDSGAVIAGHGGILDRCDALFATFPVAWLVAAAVEGSVF